MYAFDGFRLDPVSRTLLRGVVRIPMRAQLLEVLLYLVENRGRLVERGELRRAVWPDRTVDDANVAKAVSSLRLALKAHCDSEAMIVTAPGRGYRFVAPVVLESVEQTSIPTLATPPAAPASRRRRWLIGIAVALLGAQAALALAFALTRQQVLSHGGQAAFSPPPRSVAVLSFANTSGEAKDSHFAAGLSDELISALGRVRTLRVAASSSSFTFKSGRVDATEVGRRLNVATVLEGSVSRSGGRVRLKTQLVDTVSGYQLWSQTFDRDEGERVSVEDRIAASVVTSLKIALLGAGINTLTLGSTANSRAFDSYLRGVSTLSEADESSQAPAISAFSEAIALDPGYSLAYVHRALAEAYAGEAANYADSNIRRAFSDNALRDAEHAVALTPDLGAAHAALGYVLKFRLGDFQRTQAEFTRAVQLAPGDAAILMNYGFFQLDLGHVTDGLTAAMQASSLDPLNPHTYRLLAYAYSYARRFDEARAALRHATQLPPPDPAADRMFLSKVLNMQGDGLAALRSCEDSTLFRDLMCQALAYHSLGRQGEAEAALRRMREKEGNEGAYNYARVYAAWGDRTEALKWLKIAYNLRDGGLVIMHIDPAMDNIRNAPAYLSIEKSLGFPR
jgi:TolB-like protein/DNA-binding winged helix-turn-helix (wHTH) protein/Flp pilus assembly protein TadD